MSDELQRFPRVDYAALDLYSPDRRPVEVDLSDNTNRWGANPAALAAVREVHPDRLTRYPVLYADPLRKVAARAYGVRPEQISTGSGSDDVLDSLWRAVAEFGGTVAYPAPTFSMIEPFSRMNGRTPRPVSWDDALADPSVLLEDDPVLVYVCRPNNPTGHAVERAWIDRLFATCDDRYGTDAGPVIVFDEAYAEFMTGDAGGSLIPLAVERPRTLVIRTLSKAYALAGVRVGFGFGTADTVLEVEKSRGPYKVSQLAEVAAIAALRDEDGWVRTTVRQAVENRSRLVAELIQRGFSPLPSEANFLFVPVADGTARTLSNRFREHDVAVRPFTATDDFAEGVRVTIGPWAQMERFLEVCGALGDALRPAASGPVPREATSEATPEEPAR